MLFNQYKADKTKSIIYHLSKKYIKGNCLDIGAGTGSFVEFLRNKGFEASGIDIEPPSNAVDVVQMDAEQMSYENMFDTIFMNDFIEHVESTKIILEKAFKALKRRGHLILITPDTEILENNNVCCPQCGKVFHRNYHKRSFDMSSITLELRRSGFIIEKQKSIAMHFNKYMTGWPFTSIIDRLGKTKSLFIVGEKI